MSIARGRLTDLPGSAHNLHPTIPAASKDIGLLARMSLPLMGFLLVEPGLCLRLASDSGPGNLDTLAIRLTFPTTGSQPATTNDWMVLTRHASCLTHQKKRTADIKSTVPFFILLPHVNRSARPLPCLLTYLGKNQILETRRIQFIYETSSS